MSYVCRKLFPAILILILFAGTHETLAQQNGQRPPTAVEAEKVSVETVVDEADAIGSTIANEEVVVRPEIAGRITGFDFKEGEAVKAGTVLFQLDDSLYKAESSDARSQFNLAKRNYDRAKELNAKGAGTVRALDEARSQYETASAALQLADVRLQKTKIVAPFDGIVGLRDVSVGDYVNAGQDLTTLIDNAPLKVDFQIPEIYLARISVGQTVKVTADAFPGETFTGAVYAIDPQIDTRTRSVRIRAEIPNDDGRLKPGLFVRVKVALESRPNAIVIPEQALVTEGGNISVFKVVDGKAVQVPVTVGQRSIGRAEILKGLEPGDTVITAGQLKIRNGSPVNVIDSGA